MRGDGLECKGNAFDVTKSVRSDRDDRPAVVGDGNLGCAGAWHAAPGAALARLWLLARLPLARADRMGTGAKSPAGLLVWRPGLLSRALERRRLRPVLDPDPDRQCLELRPVGKRRRRKMASARDAEAGRRGHHSQTLTRRIPQP